MFLGLSRSNTASPPASSPPLSSPAPPLSDADSRLCLETIRPPSVRIVAVVGEGASRPLKGATWSEVMLHTETVKWIERNSRNIQNIISFDSSPGLSNKLGGSVVQTETKGTIFGKLVGTFESKQTKETSDVIETISEAWMRCNSDDIRFSLLVVINAYIRPVPILKNLRSKGFSTLNCMVKNCGPQILNCLLDPNCRKALQCLNQCSPVDQVCNYRCIASYESPNLEAFSLCVLQKNNCLGLDATIPEKPYIPPMVKFRGENICHESAEDLFVGWLGNLDWSWRVVAGQNPAYAMDRNFSLYGDPEYPRRPTDVDNTLHDAPGINMLRTRITNKMARDHNMPEIS
ncbi:hypothetical protein EUGRSUZ_L02754 [Eucalyptus grandis]|uniref:VDE lipocalin domain-containing protein n=1 Tax=Eucalyptus grandis TaxID=71139 RepID=A0AAD9T9J9_EUCGR|nr:hypothetical protein EUGRSUZ_L02754 [Eucalyptus grandis]